MIIVLYCILLIPKNPFRLKRELKYTFGKHKYFANHCDAEVSLYLLFIYLFTHSIRDMNLISHKNPYIEEERIRIHIKKKHTHSYTSPHIYRWVRAILL